ncbi:MAG: hypothetical protein ACRELV_08790, partial [Longimicrobiales bacterium]
MLDRIYFGNTVQAWLFALAAGVLAVGALQLLRTVLTSRLRALGEKTSTALDDVLAETLAATRSWFVVLVGIWVASLVPELPARLIDAIQNLMIVTLVVQAGVWTNTAINRWV